MGHEGARSEHAQKQERGRDQPTADITQRPSGAGSDDKPGEDPQHDRASACSLC